MNYYNRRAFLSFFFILCQFEGTHKTKGDESRQCMTLQGVSSRGLVPSVTSREKTKLTLIEKNVPAEQVKMLKGRGGGGGGMVVERYCIYIVV